MNRKLAVILIISAIIGVAWLAGDRVTDHAPRALDAPTVATASRPSARSGESATVASRADTRTSAGRDATPPAPAFVVLPPANTPVKALLAQLRSAAELGQPPAACRVGVELTACRNARYIARQADADEESARRIGDAQERAKRISVVEQERAANQAALALCEGVSDREIADAWRYLWTAAQAGNVAAMSKFARDPGLSVSDLAASAEGWAVYRDYAPRFFWGAIQGGDVMALFSNWFALMSGLTVGGKGVIERDPYMALVYGNAALPLLDARRQAMVARVNARLAQEMKPDLALQAAAEGQRLRVQYFASAATTRDTLEDGYAVPEDCAR